MLFVSFTNHNIGDYGVETDFYVAYVPQARELLNGNLIIDQYRGPLYQICLAAMGLVFSNDYFLAGKLLNVISASLTLFFISKIISSIFSKEGAFIAVLLVAVNHIFWRYSFEAGTDMLFLVFYTSSLYFILRNKDLNNKDLFTAGILSGMAYLTRYTGISLIVLMAIIFTVQFYKKFKENHSFNKSFPLKPIIYYIIPVVILFSVWGIISYQKTGHFFYNMNFQNTAYTVYKPENVSKDEWISKNQNTFKSMADVISRDPAVFAKTMLKNFSSYFIKDILRFFPKYIGILVGIGLLIFLIKWKSENLMKKYFFLGSLIFYLQILLIFYSERFSLPLLPFYCFLVVRLFSHSFLRKFNRNVGRFKFYGILLLTLIILNLYNSYLIAKEEINTGPKEILFIKDWIETSYQDNLSGKLIMARKPHVAYYLDMKLVVTPFAENYQQFIENVKSNNVDYVFVSETETAYLPDENLRKKLLNYSEPPEEMEIVTNTTNPTAILYKVKKEGL